MKNFHEELNYFGDKKVLKLKSCKNFNDFNKEYIMNNSSIISELFSGTLKNIKKCKSCKNTNSLQNLILFLLKLINMIKKYLTFIMDLRILRELSL